ncbi:proline iminopeptidase [Pseudoalteromonas citrea]|uniref:Proline iminopeptidase n=2 Tax=Pseudoalteromonas citrea TaxID=43655 RepID=A0AAD4FQM2_9GAMM|nr:alpha/beta fold hydrolase [Pseudoalteromonas citrea]KAF7765139.1 proline iminopeptidase [Pseudoalteromonas citrea]
MTQRYAVSEPVRSFHLPVGEGHQIHVEEYGDVHGQPVIVCHGGPGSGLCRESAGYFNPKRYRIILFSQRGCGASTPLELTHNSPKYLVDDISRLIEHLAIGQCILAGGSWGATLALLYTSHFAHKVKGLILWASFLGADHDLEWLYGPNSAGAQFYPEQYQVFKNNESDSLHILKHYLLALTGDDELAQHKAAQRWHAWDRQLTLGALAGRYHLEDSESVLQQAKLMCHYFSPEIMSELSPLQSVAEYLIEIPTWFIHGRHDLVCRFAPVQRLAHQAHSQLFVLDGLGHCSASDVYVEAVRRAADLLACKLSH